MTSDNRVSDVWNEWKVLVNNLGGKSHECGICGTAFVTPRGEKVDRITPVNGKGKIVACLDCSDKRQIELEGNREKIQYHKQRVSLMLSENQGA